ncbi:MAG: hypothetical protein VXZ36_06050 [Pseudomonadota bacterium]|jgi:hypothetical protein|uniref:hypothetical protein n=1 Tax=Alteromonas sp. MTD1 TaxID=3057962 RepID=UPI002EBA703B|nr:hypothetical protein [Pseudomonadota bacterium]MEC8417362.1 hypothetical protein [Pseudomonadota bacterium]|tara:strand:+ start:265 stop:444 length:180 start_codon:yes stop_codon:yes gene_type:complete
MKKISSKQSKTSPFTRIMQKGHEKTRYKPPSGKLLMQLSENDHKRIAKLISQWLDSKEN